MTEQHSSGTAIPVLTDVVTEAGSEAVTPPAAPLDRDTLIAELQTQLAASAYSLAEQVLRSAFAEMEAALFEQVSKRLRRELPELVDRILREHLDTDRDET